LVRKHEKLSRLVGREFPRGSSPLRFSSGTSNKPVVANVLPTCTCDVAVKAVASWAANTVSTTGRSRELHRSTSRRAARARVHRQTFAVPVLCVSRHICNGDSHNGCAIWQTCSVHQRVSITTAPDAENSYGLPRLWWKAQRSFMGFTKDGRRYMQLMQTGMARVLGRLRAVRI